VFHVKVNLPSQAHGEVQIPKPPHEYATAINQKIYIMIAIYCYDSLYYLIEHIKVIFKYCNFAKIYTNENTLSNSVLKWLRKKNYKILRKYLQFYQF
jgi:hypothetical protein